MKTYENRFFRFRLVFPDAWQLTSWRHTNIARSVQSAYQAADNDLPKRGQCGSKFLFTAALHPPESVVLVDADIELSVFRLSPSEDLRTSLVQNFERQRVYYENSGIESTIVEEGAWTIGGMDFTYLDEDSKSRSGHSWYRFFFRPHHEAVWLYGKIAGHKRPAYHEALKILEGLKSNADV
jgi:hypothetical protein